jgi:hypothetical protein
MMSGTIDDTIEGTEGIEGEFKYRKAGIDSKPVTAVTWQYSTKIQSVPTSRTSGEIKLRIAAREMPEATRVRSTK